MTKKEKGFHNQEVYRNILKSSLNKNRKWSKRFGKAKEK
jgi:hypothetical protein